MMSDYILIRLHEFCISIKILLQHEGCKTMQMANVLLNVAFLNYAKYSLVTNTRITVGTTYPGIPK